MSENTTTVPPAELVEQYARIFEAGMRMKRSQHELLRPAPGSVLFLGDSITEGGQWNEWFPQLTTYNRGIGGDTVAGVTGRLDAAINDPAVISLLVGTNDLSSMLHASDPQDVGERGAALVAELRERAPRARILVNAVMPRTPELRAAIDTVDAVYAEAAERAGAVFVDTRPVLEGADGGIRAEFSLDQLHLTGAGYRAWVSLLSPHLGA